jgi:hypothetical protein
MADLTEDQIRQQEDEEFEFRARAEEEERARQQASVNTPKEGPVSPEGPGVMGNVVGGLQTIGQVAAEHAPEIGGALGLYKTAQAINAYRQGANSKLYGDLLNNYSKLNHDIRQYEKMKQVVPQELIDARSRLGQQIEVAQSKLPGYDKAIKAPPGPINPATAPGTAPAPTAPAQAAGAIAPEAEAAAQAARTAAAPTNAISSGFSQQLQNLSRGGANILNRMAPYLQTAGRIAAPVARVAGPAGMALTAAEAYPYLQQAEIGPRTQSGEVGKMVQGANRMALNMPTAAPLNPTEARNLLDSGDERTIKIYGGRQRLQQIINAGK